MLYPRDYNVFLGSGPWPAPAAKGSSTQWSTPWVETMAGRPEASVPQA